MSQRTEVLFLALLLSACAAPPEGATFRGGPVAPDRFGLVILRDGEVPPALTAEQRSEAFAEHFGFIEASARRQELLLSGPFGQPKDVDDMRGLFVFDASEEEEIAALGAGDPTTRMGIFRQDAMTLDTLDLLRQLPEMVRDHASRRVRSRDAGPEVVSYTVLFAEDGPTALTALGSSLFAERVVLLGRLGAPRGGELFGILDVADPEEVRARLAAAGFDVTGVELARWYATPVLREFARPGDGGVAGESPAPPR
ncbi:MAG: hypothetical protein VXZ39_07115 [Planctomycetota bacterium]|nr:hypothetical protein [Planctomycetota bacterium]MEC8494673.1 hypothetical protein [Planctomycetota bacterium]MEC8511694.1 hypothetical protein [Planctomycetota bacterium]